MDRIEVFPGTELVDRDIELVSDQIREVERLEAATVYPQCSVEDAIRSSMALSEIVYFFTVDEQIAGIFGLNLQDHGWNQPWSMTTDDIGKVPVEFARKNREFTKYFRGFGPMYQFVHKDNQLSRRYLRHSGFHEEAHFPQFRGTQQHFIRVVHT